MENPTRLACENEAIVDLALPQSSQGHSYAALLGIRSLGKNQKDGAKNFQKTFTALRRLNDQKP